jgi:hypothetical protein
MPKNITDKSHTTSAKDFLTDAEIKKAIKLYRIANGSFHQRCMDEIIKPVITRINKALGQENDPRWLAYAVEFFCMKGGISKTNTEKDNEK